MQPNDIIKDRYQLLRPLGAGGFGEVWLAKDQMTGTHCAIKFYVRLDDAGRSEFRGEYSRMLGIHHPNLLTASYYDEWQGRPFLVMDYCGGGAASGKVVQLSETELWRLIRDVASGLACLHGQRDARGKEVPVIHQDIKPANFLQKGDGTWLISDFGISSRMRSSMSSQSGREVSSGGTIPYMGPERFGQGKMLVKSSDIWALGASVYEMATRELPFDEYGGILQKKGEEIPHLPGERWSPELDRLVSSCLQKETWDRPSAALVAEYADCKLKGKPLPKLPKETPPSPPNPIPKPKPWKWIAAVGIVVAVVLAIVLWPKSPKPAIDDSLERVQDSLDRLHEYIDLDLPSGTLWATCNVGATKPEDYGGYFAWGETATKTDYSWETYQHCMGTVKTLTKYCNKSNDGYNGYTDDLSVLEPTDDAATANWGNGWCTPSETQWEELLANTTNEWTTKNGVMGRLFTSKKNGATLFFPAAGNRWDSELNDAGFKGCYWSRSRHPDVAFPSWYLQFTSEECCVYGRRRPTGFSVRPVREKSKLAAGESENIPLSSVTIQIEGSGGTVGNKNVSQTNNDKGSASGGNSGNVNVSGPANGYEYVDLGLPSGTKWATCNIGANKPEDYGNYYAWGETSTKSTYNWENYKYANGSDDKLTKYCSKSGYGNNGFTDGLTALQTADDPATANWGSGWRTPSKAQWDELLANTTNQWTTRSGVKGCEFTSKKNGAKLFLPAAGCRLGSDLDFVGSNGLYWSRSLSTDRPHFAWSLHLSVCGMSSILDRFCGFTVRPVRQN